MTADTSGIESAAKQLVAVLERRDAAIVAAHEAGASLRTIAAAAGMSHEGVRAIVARAREAADS